MADNKMRIFRKVGSIINNSTPFVIMITIFITIVFGPRILCKNLLTPTKPYNVYSSSTPSVQERVQIVSHQHSFTIQSRVLDIEYKLHIEPSSLGPSTVDYRIGVKIDPNDIDKWITPDFVKDNHPGETVSEYMSLLSPVVIKWKLCSSPKYYYSKTIDETAIVYTKEGVILFDYQ